MQDTLRNRILAELAHGRKMKSGQIIEVLRVQKDRVYRELAIAVELGYLVKHGQPPASEYVLASRSADPWGDGRAPVNTGHLVPDALANRSAMEVAWANGQRMDHV